MKTVFIFFSIWLFSLPLFGQEISGQRMTFSTLSISKDSMFVDQDKVFEFPFTNNSNVPVTIANVKSSCGCLVPNWPKNPLLPGESGKIIAVFYRKFPGPMNKSITVSLTNPEEYIILRLDGMVLSSKSGD